MAVAYYYDHMTKPKQAAYRSMLAGLTELTAACLPVSQSLPTAFSCRS